MLTDEPLNLLAVLKSPLTRRQCRLVVAELVEACVKQRDGRDCIDVQPSVVDDQALNVPKLRVAELLACDHQPGLLGRRASDT